MKPCETVKARMWDAALTKRFDSGIRIGFGNHALARSVSRYYKFMSMDLLMDNIYGLLSQVPDLDDRLMDIPVNERFVIVRESDGLTIFASYDYNTIADTENAGDLLVFVHTILVAEERRRIWVDDRDKLLLKICKDGSIQENPWELRLGTR